MLVSNGKWQRPEQRGRTLQITTSYAPDVLKLMLFEIHRLDNSCFFWEILKSPYRCFMLVMGGGWWASASRSLLQSSLV